MKRILCTLLTSVSLMTGIPAFAHDHCNCSKKCAQACKEGKSEDCSCKTCGSEKGDSCDHGKCDRAKDHADAHGK